MSAPFRIRKATSPNTSIEEGRVAVKASDKPKAGKFNNYLARLVAMIPSEVIGIYLMLSAAVENKQLLVGKYAWISLTCLVLVIVSRSMGTYDAEEGNDLLRRVEWPVVIISAISFVIWVMAIGDQFPWLSSFNWFDDKVSIMGMVAVWTFVVPYIYKPKES